MVTTELVELIGTAIWTNTLEDTDLFCKQKHLRHQDVSLS